MDSDSIIHGSKLEDADKFKKQRLLKRTLQLVVSVSLLSLFLSFASGFSLFLDSLYIYFNTCLFSLLTQTLERKYMFLLCNGILAFLAKTSTLSLSGPDQDCRQLSEPSLRGTKIATTNNHVEVPARDVESLQSFHPVAAEEENKEADQNQVVENEVLFTEIHKQEDAVAEDDQTKEGDDLPNTDELNRRIEEFIKKMKEEIRTEIR